ncbi:hypothetical protein KCU77_g2436, partial [Aureobasidium melanogenum]
METFRGIPISKIREHYMREGYRNEMFSSMIADVIEGNPGVGFDIERTQPEQQEQRIWELDSDEELLADPTGEEKEKKRAKNKKKYQRKKEKAQAEKAKFEEQKAEEQDDTSQSLRGLSIQDAAPILADDRKSSSVEDNIAASATPSNPQPKLSKRQKKTALKKAKQAQNATPTTELAGSPTTSDSTSASTSASNGLNSKVVNGDESKKKNKVDGNGYEEPKHDDEEKEVATESEVEAVMDTVAKRFGQ